MEREVNEYKCELCRATFKSSKGLKSHYRNRHGRGGDDELMLSVPKSPKKACPRCGKSVANPYAHKHTCSGESAKPTEIKSSKLKAELTASETSISEDVTEQKAGTKTLTEAEKHEREKTKCTKTEKAKGTSKPSFPRMGAMALSRDAASATQPSRAEKKLLEEAELAKMFESDGEGSTETSDDAAGSAQRDASWSVLLSAASTENVHQLSLAQFLQLYRNWIMRRHPNVSAETVQACVVQVFTFIVAEEKRDPRFKPRRWLMFAVEEDFTPLKRLIDWLPPGTIRALGMLKAQAYLHMVSLILHCLVQSKASLTAVPNWDRKHAHLKRRQQLATLSYNELLRVGKLLPVSAWQPVPQVVASSNRDLARNWLTASSQPSASATAGDSEVASSDGGEAKQRSSDAWVGKMFEMVMRPRRPKGEKPSTESQTSVPPGSVVKHEVATGDDDGGDMSRGASDAKPDEEMETEEVAPEATPVQEAVAAEATQTETTDNDTRQLCHGSTFFQVDHQEVTVFIML